MSDVAVEHTRPPISRLTKVELRKTLDTRSGLWILFVLAAATVALVGLTVIDARNGQTQISFQILFGYAQFPLSLLLVIVGLRTCSTEFANSSPMITFALVPVRNRVILAKLIAMSGVALFAVVFSGALAALATGAAQAIGISGIYWDLDAELVSQVTVVQVITALVGAALGLALLSLPLGIIIYLVAAMLGVFALGASQVERFVHWVDFPITSGTLLTANATTTNWAQLAVSCLLWLALPLVIGIQRMALLEIK